MSESLSREDFVFTHKPAGVATHRPSDQHQGFVEWMERQLKINLKVCHRLDKETSGALVLAKNKKAARILGELFENHKVQKEYLFLSTEESKYESWLVEEEKAKGTLVRECPCNEGAFRNQTVTRFLRVSRHGLFFLYKALPLSGKTHQIRKHAIRSGVPILGDELYGGTPFPRLMLHSERLSFMVQGQSYEHSARTSRLFRSPELCENTQLASWLVAYERREVLFPEQVGTEQGLRIFHSETGDLRGDQVGSRLVLGWWKSEKPTETEIANLKTLMEVLGYKDWVFQWRPGTHDKSSAEILLGGEGYTDGDWGFKENNVTCRASLERGQNFGLFFDQRERREWVQENSQGRNVLNLFAFTCGFSLNAALGGAQQVVSVDSFKKYLEWGKENFLASDCNPEDPRYEWRTMDALAYLDFAHKKEMKFDLIVCDPPSFSRAKKTKKVFRIERDFPQLLEACANVLKPQGTLLFSTNYEKWDLSKWQHELTEQGKPLGFHDLLVSPSQWDYEFQGLEANLKAFFLQKA